MNTVGQAFLNLVPVAQKTVVKEFQVFDRDQRLVKCRATISGQDFCLKTARHQNQAAPGARHQVQLGTQPAHVQPPHRAQTQQPMAAGRLHPLLRIQLRKLLLIRSSTRAFEGAPCHTPSYARKAHELQRCALPNTSKSCSPLLRVYSP